jgi:hypothetical protein
VPTSFSALTATELEPLDPHVLKCRQCRVKHSVAFGSVCRASMLSNTRNGKLTDYSDKCVLSKRMLGRAITN